MEITCINCPVGCRLDVTLENGQVVSVTGNTCKRGETYARQECVDPQRMVTAVIPVAGSAVPLSVKTRTPIPKKRIADCMRALSEVQITAPVAAGSVVLADVCGTGVDVIATKSV
ncbi:MAG: DUF1667 domain-containing protein [Clostridiales bacterium]|nr:DUF1667 domain-containing protein [Clostridiales bacterium]